MSQQGPHLPPLRGGPLLSRKDGRGRNSAEERKLALVGVEALPAAGAEPLERAEARLVGHSPRALDPIAEIDIGQARPPGADDMVEDDVGAEAGAAALRRRARR